jgi:hypothetical protein
MVLCLGAWRLSSISSLGLCIGLLEERRCQSVKNGTTGGLRTGTTTGPTSKILGSIMKEEMGRRKVSGKDCARGRSVGVRERRVAVRRYTLTRYHGLNASKAPGIHRLPFKGLLSLSSSLSSNSSSSNSPAPLNASSSSLILPNPFSSAGLGNGVAHALFLSAG